MRWTMTAAIYFYPEAYTTNGPKLMGRNSAGASFLRGFVAHSQATEFWAMVEKPAHIRDFSAAVRAAGRHEPVKAASKHNLGVLTQVGTAYYPAPGIGGLAWQRALFGHGGWSLCGITHTISSAGAMDSLAELLTAPVQPWDAVICTSTVARHAVQRVWQAHAAHLKQRLGIRQLVLPQLPVIPLGIQTADFAFSESQRFAARTALGADEQTLVVLFAGRLSFHAKAHPLVMYQALEQAARQLAVGQKVLLVECGEHANASISQAFNEAASMACPSVRVLSLPGRKGDNYRNAWAGADVFCSLSDNFQETFGLTPLEAMAAGLPVVVSDWDGYKDTVRDGVDGFRVPTLMPQDGLGSDLARRHALEIDNFDMYCGHTCSLVAVDVDAAAQAFVRLFSSPVLRRQMGDAGRARAREVFDWAAIIPRYEALWTQLTEIRQAHAPALKPLQHPWPARADPFHAFASYPTNQLTPQTVLSLVNPDPGATARHVADCRGLAMVNFAQAVLPTEAEVDAMVHAAERGPLPAIDLVSLVPPERHAVALRSLAWLVKLGALKVWT
jgi:alpha-maltose-1-phosphate synthase